MIREHALPDAEEQFGKFLTQLSVAAVAEGWALVQYTTPHTDRSLELRQRTKRVPFVVHLSQTESGFWGIQFTTYEQMENVTKEHLVLLRSVKSGYFIPHAALKRAKKKFSHTSAAWRINEATIRNELRFRSLEEVVLLLTSRTAA